jgi:hypothetical protein
MMMNCNRNKNKVANNNQISLQPALFTGISMYYDRVEVEPLVRKKKGKQNN